MGKFQDLTGQTFGYWTVIEKDSSPKSKKTYWICKCKCGKIKSVRSDILKRNNPIWVFSLASPVREFCRQAAGKIKAADYVLVHHTKGKYESVAAEMDRLLGIPHTASVSVQCRMGKFEICR